MLPSHPFILSFLNAYNQHGDVLLTPDDIWLVITKFISRYIDENAEVLRHKLVRHEGKQTLTVIEKVSSLEETEQK